MMSNEELKRGITFDEILRMFKYPPYDKEEEETKDDNHYHPGGFVQDFGEDDIPVVKVAPPPVDKLPTPPLEYWEGLQ